VNGRKHTREQTEEEVEGHRRPVVRIYLSQHLVLVLAPMKRVSSAKHLQRPTWEGNGGVGEEQAAHTGF
jgi:hypothetical protein